MVTTAPPKFIAGSLFFGGNMAMDKAGGAGWVTAVEAITGKIRWRYHNDYRRAWVTPTAGGVTFTGDTAGNFLVFDSETGKVLRKDPVGGAMAAGVVTYALGGKHVAIAAGNVSRATFGELGVPTIHIMSLPADAITTETAGIGHGKAIYGQICVSCHGADGTAVKDHDLRTVNERKDLAATIAFIKDPQPPMPKLFPSPLSEGDVADVAAYLQRGW